MSSSDSIDTLLKKITSLNIDKLMLYAMVESKGGSTGVKWNQISTALDGAISDNSRDPKALTKRFSRIKAGVEESRDVHSAVAPMIEESAKMGAADEKEKVAVAGEENDPATEADKFAKKDAVVKKKKVAVAGEESGAAEVKDFAEKVALVKKKKVAAAGEEDGAIEAAGEVKPAVQKKPSASSKKRKYSKVEAEETQNGTQ